MPCIVHSTSQCALRLCLGAALIAAATTWSAPGHAQADTSKSNPAQPGTGTQPATGPSSLSDIAPRSAIVDPCKAKNPPAYCNKR
jgi:hypothetical protein